MSVSSQENNYLTTLCNTIHIVTGMSIFFLDRDLNLLTAYSKWENHLKNIFVMNCPYDLSSVNNQKPMYFSDSLHLSWMIIPILAAKSFVALGPVFETDVTHAFFQKEMGFQNMAVSSKIHFLKMINDIPVIPYQQLFQYMTMLYYEIYDFLPDKNYLLLKASHSEEMPYNSVRIINDKSHKTPVSHGSMLPEKLMLEGVRTGNIHIFSGSNPSVIVGTLSNGDPLRQAKNAIITQISLVTRAAVDGGMAAEAAYSLSDFYIQKIELCTTSDKVYALSQEMYHTFVQQVHEVQTQNYTSLVIYMCAYIDKHIRETISLDAMAKKLGYDTYYLTTLFKKDTGKSIKTYILEKKIDYAKVLLSTTLMNIQEISDQLSFKSLSYFSTQFKKTTGESPLSFRKKGHFSV